MSTQTDPRKSVRVIALSATDKNVHRTVNIVTSVAGDVHHSIKPHAQVTAAQAVAGITETVMDSGGSKPGLPTIFISGYSGPS